VPVACARLLRDEIEDQGVGRAVGSVIRGSEPEQRIE
jgi:hypothetical protein